MFISFFFLTVYCDPIVITNCPDDTHRLVTVNNDLSYTSYISEDYYNNGASVSWEPPAVQGEKERPASCQVIHQPPNRNSGNLFGIGVETVTYLFSDASGNEANCSFIVNTTEGQNSIFYVNLKLTLRMNSNYFSRCDHYVLFQNNVYVSNMQALATI